VALIRPELLDPLPSQYWLDNSTPVENENISRSTKLRCVSITPKAPPKGDTSHVLFPSYCFSPEKPILRSNTAYNAFQETVFNRILLFQGRYIGGDIEILRLTKSYAKVHVDLVEPLNQPVAADFQPPADAVAPPPRRISVSGGVAAGNILTKVQPDYPVYAQTNHIQGTVVLQATISDKGQVTSLNVISGPKELQSAALDAVHQWIYKPYLLNGEPVEVQTTINVVFSLSGH
jgi:TonB family protein